MPKKKETKAERDNRLKIFYEPEPAKVVRRAYEHIKGRLPPMWTAALTVDNDAELAVVTLKDGDGKVAKRLYGDDIRHECGFGIIGLTYSRHVKWAWRRFRKTGA